MKLSISTEAYYRYLIKFSNMYTKKKHQSFAENNSFLLPNINVYTFLTTNHTFSVKISKIFGTSLIDLCRYILLTLITLFNCEYILKKNK